MINADRKSINAKHAELYARPFTVEITIMLFRFLILAFILMTTPTFAQTPPLETGVSQTLAKWRAANYSDVRYKLNITLEKGAPLMNGEIEIRVKLTDEGAKNDLILDWRTTQFADDKDKPFANVVEVNEQKIKSIVQGFDSYNYFISNEHLGISRFLLKTGENVIKINFASPIKTSGAAITRYVDKEDGAEYVYSLFVPSDASTAFPVFDQPDLKAKFQLNLRVPEKWNVIGNQQSEVSGTWIERMDNGTSIIYKFSETKPISTYVFAFAAGEFAVFEDKQSTIPSKLYVRKSQAAKLSRSADGSSAASATARANSSASNNSANEAINDASRVGGRAVRAPIDEVFRLNREGIKFLESYFDYKFPFPKYDLVLIPEFPFGGMEHAGATFLREDRVIFPTEPTKNDYITRANVIFHEAAHQWFGDTVTMKWFDDLWLKEGFAEFMAYKTLEKVMPEYNAWKVFYERNKQAAYLTDVTRGTTPIYQEIPNLSSAKSAYGNIVYRKAPSFLRQAEFYLGEDKFQTAVRAFLKKHEFANAEWTDLVNEFKVIHTQDLEESKELTLEGKEKFERVYERYMDDWANTWVKKRGLPIIRVKKIDQSMYHSFEQPPDKSENYSLDQDDIFQENNYWQIKTSWQMKTKVLLKFDDDKTEILEVDLDLRLGREFAKYSINSSTDSDFKPRLPKFIFPNYQDYGYGIFLLDEKSRAYVLENIQNEKDDFLRSMMWGSLWDSVRFYELAPEDYVKLVIKNINVETDESTISTLLGRVSTAMNYYLSDAQRDELAPKIEKLLIEKIETAPSVGQKITYFRALQNIGSSEQTKRIFKDLLTGKSKLKDVELKTKDKFDLLTRLIVLGDADALNLLAELEKTETNDAAKRYAYAAKAGIATKENKAKYWNDFVNNKEISESYIESAFNVWNTPKQSELTLPYLEKALAELPNLKKNRKIFFVNGWLSAFIGGQKSAEALDTVNKFLAANPNLDIDLRRKILENADNLERAVKIRAKFAGK